MNETVREWIAKAEGDYHTAGRELKVVNSPNYDAVCFHAQQCVEKLMKALLIARSTMPPKSHDLLELNRPLEQLPVRLPCSREELRFLSLSSVAFRYPGESADRPTAEKAYSLCTRLRQSFNSLLKGTN